MTPIKDNHDACCFLVTKHSWKGKYKRIFSVGTAGITTYNPDKLEITNRWAYADVLGVVSSGKSNAATINEFSLILRKDKKIDSMKFSSEYKNVVLTEAYKYRHLFADKPKEILRYEAYKHHWSDTRLPIVLEVTPCSLDQLDPVTNTPLASYSYREIEGIINVQDYVGGFVIACGGFSRLHLFASSNPTEIINKVTDAALNNLGITLKVLPTKISLDDFQNQRFGKYSGDLHQTSICEFSVHKVNSLRHIEPPRRTLCLTDSCILERDPQTYSICSLRPLSEIWALIRDPQNPQLFFIEYMNGHIRCYLAGERDALLASLLDGVRSSGNRDVHVKMQPTPRGKRLSPLNVAVDEETESNNLRFLITTVGHSRADMVERFNANIAYSGLLYSVNQDRLFSENKEKLIAQAIQSLLQIGDSGKDNSTSLSAYELEGQFHALRRLGASKVGFAAFTAMAGFREAMGSKVIAALRKGDVGVTHAALDALCALLHPMHMDYDLRQEQLNKSSMLSSKNFLEGLLDMWTEHVNQNSGALVVTAMLDFLTFSLCVPYSETTDSKYFDQLLELVALRGRFIFKLFEHPSMAIVKGAGLVMRALIEEGSLELGTKMQALALAEAALLRHLLIALYGTSRPQQRHLSRHLVGLWATGHPPTAALLKRIFPSGLLSFLDSTEKVPQNALNDSELSDRDNLKLAQDASSKNKKGPQWLAIERQIRVVEKHLEHYTHLALQHWSAHTGIIIERKEKQRERPIVLRKRREKIKADANWPMFFYQFSKDHSLPNLIWNHKTREELRVSLENELQAFNSDRELGGSTLVSWNHAELEIQYKCLQDEVRIGDYYLRLLLEAEDCPESPIRKSYEFFNELYHKFLLTTKIEMKSMCLRAMAIVYGRYYEDIGPFTDTKYIIQMLEKSVDKVERDRLIIFLTKLIRHRKNVKDILDWNGVRILVDLMTLSHLHTSRATVPAQNNLLEAAPSGGQTFSDREWYYNIEKSHGHIERIGPVSLQDIKNLYRDQKINSRTKCWASGMDGWRVLQSIPQLKWTLLAKGSPVLNESELASQILDILIKCCEYFPSRDDDNAIIRPLPKIKKMLSDSYCLAHVVQVLLTFDPILVEKVAVLLCEIMQDNPDISKIYLTGVFYFILMYTGSNVLPIARFLQLTHMKQAFRAEDVSSDIMQKSVLGQLLPEAMVCYLENHGADKFAQIFLGEYDTPEAIWNSEMRRILITKVSAHIGDFTPRLKIHIGARYPYLAIPAVRYPQLDSELFCNIFYLRHLCDIVKFPDWPIPDPVKLLKDILETWKKEVEKKPPIMTVEEAYKTLGLAPGKVHDEANIRKSYYKLAQQYHPDKNPQGRDHFESVNQAYEFLCSRNVWAGSGPNPNNIVLVLKAQSILFSRYLKELEPYKYAGYPQLIKTIKMETKDETLFKKSAPLLAAGCELAYYTLCCSALNAEELRREGGLQVLLEAYSRCVSVITLSSTPTDVAVQVCYYISKCYGVAASFSSCRNVIGEMSSLIIDLCRILQFNHLGQLCCSAVECVSALSVDGALQTQLLRCGVLWPLLKAALQYDFTLEEGGVERTEKTNQQEVINQLAKQSIIACARLGGYLTDDQETPCNQLARNAFKSLLTPYISNKFTKNSPEEILKILNSNWRIPYLIWDNSTRTEFCEFLQNRRTFASNDDTNDDIILCIDFTYSAHKGQLIVGDIFLQIYNEQPEYPIENPKGFTIDLLEFLNKQSQMTTNNEVVCNIVLSLEALFNVIKTNPGVGIQCIGHFGLIFGLLSARSFPDIQKNALQVVICSSSCSECIDDIAAGRLLGHLLPLITHNALQNYALSALSALLTNTSIVSEALNKGAVVYLLDLFCNSNSESVVETSAELLAKMLADKLHGPKVKLLLCRYLPAIFSDAMRSGGGAMAARMLSTPQQHPELVWDSDAKERVASVVSRHKQEHYSAQISDPGVLYSATVDFNEGGALAWTPPGEIVVGGVYLRLFIANPQWALRSPRAFLSDLFDTVMIGLQKDGQDEVLELCRRAICGLLNAQPSLADLVAGRGHLSRLCRYLASNPHHTLPIIHSIANNNICVNALAQTECISGLKQAMKCRQDLTGLACEALSRIFTSSANTDELVHQALETDMVEHLLSLLEGKLDGITSSGQITAQVVAALKAMSKSVLHGDKVKTILTASPAWQQYANQRHDLFITDVPIAGYLTGNIPQSAGYLTQGPTSNITLQPPPID